VARFRTRSVLRWVALAALFALAYAQAPLYYSNQNQYFLHGVAKAGCGGLEEDWLANTADPTQVFSGLVHITLRLLHPYAFHVYYALLMGVYLGSLVGIFAALAGPRGTPGARLLFLTFIVALHSALIRWGSYRLFGSDYPWYLQAGVAGQYVLGAVLQPSTFGVLLVLAISLFLHSRPFSATACLCLAAIFHSTYLLPAAMLVLAFMAVLWREGQGKRALQLAGWAVLPVLPALVLVFASFRPTSAETFAEAQEILCHFRIPHHCLPKLWLDEIAGFQIGWILLGMALSWGTRLFFLMLLCMAMGTVLTVAQVLTQSDTLALLFPWRISAVLVPLATAVLVSRLVLLLHRWLDRAVVRWVNVALVLGFACAGVVLMWFRQGFQASPEELGLLEFVRANRSPGDVYLLPVQIPDLKASTRGSLSSDFKPVAAKKQDARLIPVDLQRFRLTTGAPIFVDFKSIPYQDRDVLEWGDRLLRNELFYQALWSGGFDSQQERLRRNGITHIVTPADKVIAGAGLRLVYSDEFYRLYRLPD
jgi:hypothetical protein